MQLVPVYALNEHRLSVHKQLSVTYFHRTETHIETCTFAHIGPVQSAHFEPIQVWNFRAPKQRIVNYHLSHRLPFLGLSLEGRYFLAFGIGQLEFDGRYSGGYFGLDFQVAVGIGQNMYVFNALFLPGVDEDAAGDAAQAPEILVFKVRAVAPAEDLHGYDIHARMDEFCDVKTGFQLAVFAVTNHFAVYPYPHVGGGAAYAQVHRLAVPGRRDVEDPAVLAHMVAL